MAQPDISPDSENTLLGQLFLPHDMSDSYKAFLSDNEPPPEHIARTPLPLSLPNLSFDELIQDFVTDSSISSNTYIQLGFLSSDFLGEFLKLLKIFATSEMENRKEISSENSIDFYESNKRYAHSSGGRKSQTTPTDACKDNGAQLIVADISPLRPRPEASNNLSSIFGRFEIDEGNPFAYVVNKNF